ncbi:hypothetical protein TgHK011_007726 [Trichoderma gracile]|nr:hypothetical protein TgHK011_007726 [Trichoderma gracile]
MTVDRKRCLPGRGDRRCIEAQMLQASVSHHAATWQASATISQARRSLRLCLDQPSPRGACGSLFGGFSITCVSSQSIVAANSLLRSYFDLLYLFRVSLRQIDESSSSGWVDAGPDNDCSVRIEAQIDNTSKLSFKISATWAIRQCYPSRDPVPTTANIRFFAMPAAQRRIPAPSPTTQHRVSTV